MRTRSILMATGVALSTALWGTTAGAAPQVLGIVASNGVPTPLDCSGLACTGHFSTFCLQQARTAPSHGQPYTFAPGAEVTIVAALADGRSVRLPGEPHFEISSLIGFTSVSINLPKKLLAELGATAVAVEVGPNVSLLPKSPPGDVDPQTDDEIALATGPMRLAAARTFELPGEASDAARVTSALINALPVDGTEKAETRDGLWLASSANPAIAGATAEGRAMAHHIYQGCKISVESHSAYSLRNCLELRHADLLAVTNHRFWKESVGY